jgi:hypothetical protein
MTLSAQLASHNVEAILVPTISSTICLLNPTNKAPIVSTAKLRRTTHTSKRNGLVPVCRSRSCVTPAKDTRMQSVTRLLIDRTYPVVLIDQPSTFDVYCTNMPLLSRANADRKMINSNTLISLLTEAGFRAFRVSFKSADAFKAKESNALFV